MNTSNPAGFTPDTSFFESSNRNENFHGATMGSRLYPSRAFLCRRDSEESNERFNFDVFVQLNFVFSNRSKKSV